MPEVHSLSNVLHVWPSVLQKELAKHSVKAISFMTIDPDDTKTFSYIAAEGPDEQNPKRIFRLYCFKSEKQVGGVIPLVCACVCVCVRACAHIHACVVCCAGGQAPVQYMWIRITD